MRTPMTPQGRDSLMREIESLRLERHAAVEAVTDTASVGDRSHDVDYHQSRARLSSIDERIRRLRQRLASAEIIDPDRPRNMSSVRFGARVSYLDQNGRRHDVRLVGAEDADPKSGLISSSSPIGRALMGRATGDHVEVQAPRGEAIIEIVAIA